MMMLVLTLMLSGPGRAADTTAYLDIKAQPLARSLKSVAEVFDLQIAFFPDDVRDIEAPSLIGRYTADEAFSQLLQDTPLEHRFVDEHSVIVGPRENPPAERDEVYRPYPEHRDQHVSAGRATSNSTRSQRSRSDSGPVLG